MSRDMPGIGRTRMGLAAGIGLLAALLSSARSVMAHGNEVNIAVTCNTPDPTRPLTRVCTAFLTYVDGDPIDKAVFQMIAVREGRAVAPVGPVPFQALRQPGLLLVSVTFPAYGKWSIRFVVLEPGQGQAELYDEILPPVPGASG